ncbi:S-layer homology domain-containing protein [Paenibacillus sp. MMS20-IR301]|uniref:S-layer homology domain-containing protein n=1 Tax=Paenibacillus sp. MMS20-IR301 TaxID=2895946 RepID=UPI0028EBDFEC|nr:S-layer homology domain-containing protein [Paenibacillus sp. MMS20-IR301]WNS41877.1 S-layer homology domain-containing protein [Paenibacillus sp. MMS20-IR301]
MSTKFNGLLAGILGTSLLFGSMGTAAAQTAGTKDYEGHWAQQTIQSWLDKGLLKGFADGSVKPNQTVTRAEFMALVNRSYQFTATSTVGFQDVPSASWAYAEVSKAVAAGYIQGFNNEMRPNAPINRQEAAVIVSKLLKLSPGNTEALSVFRDAGQIAAWSKGSVAAAVAAGVLKGYPDGTFGPAKALTRAESLSLLDTAAAVHTGSGTELAVTPAPTATPSASPTPAPKATATAAAVGSGGGGGGGGGSQSTPTIAPTPVPTATPLAIPFVDGVKLAVNETINMTNSVNLTIDFRLVPDEMASKIDHFEQYISNGPVPVEQLLSGELYPEHFDSLYRTIVFPIYAFQLEGITDPYITQVFYNADNQPVGYFRQKTELKLMTITKSDRFSELNDGVTVSKVSVGADVYDVRIDASEALGQAGNQAVYYSITAHDTFVGPGDDASVIDDILAGQNYLYRHESGTVYFEYNSDKTYYVIFYDSNLQALNYYAGDWKRSEQKALELALTRIQALPDAAADLTLADEDAVAAALSKFDSLSEEQKGKVSTELQNKLNDSVAAIGNLRPLGSLGYPYFNAVTTGEQNYLNSASFGIDVQNLPGLLNYTSSSFKFLISHNPVTISELQMLNDGADQYDLRAGRSFMLGQVEPGTYLTVGLYDKQGKLTAYYSEPINLPVVTAQWDNPISRITDGVVITKSSYGDYSEIDVSGYMHQAAPTAAFYTVVSQSEVAGFFPEFSPEEWLAFKEFAYLYNNKQLTVTLSNSWDKQQYLIIFYDRNMKVLGYYRAEASYTEQQSLDLAVSRLSSLPASGDITIDDERRIEGARWAYEALTNNQKQLLDASYLPRLEQAEAKVNLLHTSGPLSSIPLIGGVLLNGDSPFLLNRTSLSAEYNGMPSAILRKAKNFRYYFTDGPVTQADINKGVSYPLYGMYSGGYILDGPNLPGEKYVTLVFHDKDGEPVSYNTQKVEFTIKQPVLDSSALELTEGVHINKVDNGQSQNVYINVSEILNNAQLGVSYYTVNTKSELGGEEGFTVENAVKHQNYLSTGNRTMYSGGGNQEYLIIFYDLNYKVLYYYKGGISD